MKKNLSELQQKDLAYNWHPYIQHKGMDAPIVITKGKDALLWDENGNEYIDAIGSWWCNPHGHANPAIAKAISDQIQTLEHVLFGGFTHPLAIELSEKLLSILPHNQAKVFYSDNGSTAVEVAVKMALQYHINQGVKKDCIISLEDAFHGDTFAAMAASGIGLYTESFKGLLLKNHRIPVPTPENITQVEEQLLNIIKNHKPAAFIFEPILQGAAGMRVYKPELLERLMQICKEHDVLCIADEVMTGFGRTGRLFACDYLEEFPDIMCISKALTGGFIPLAATTATQKVYDAFWADEVNKALFHGHTFMANPAGCAAALASINLSISPKTEKNIGRIYQRNLNFALELKETKGVKDIEVLGVMLRFALDQPDNDYYGELRNKIYAFFMKNRLISRPVGNVLYILPPYCITNEQLDQTYEILRKTIKKFAPKK
ncbi:adenosylmethionine--8-amino-7-oxononanoate transaminase [Ornithobacterium rhinotracheale]|uniref:adenosylmethionine--8-amino-7-oxononanoate transaminase n=1 Tax=Ornithobacterium rhinotracheale TaxID=28251 RepID=UPI00129C69E8|nr:adenosylmethionine--8-amino-7-oxononanoate transaminase [Ornithobacterium rhinotracheale]MRJ09856.1 adenosylmethionine--8-amino-7-oxononanoate transaminase [Ornithobacterium rhinotracheale]